MPRLASNFRLAGHPLLLGAASLLIFVQVWALWPRRLAQTDEAEPRLSEPGETADAGRAAQRFEGFEPPTDTSPDYSLRGLNYISVLRGQRQWQIKGQDADFYSRAQWVYSRVVTADLYDGDGRDGNETPAIQVAGRFARYSVATRNLEIGGDVIARFADGSTLQTELLEYRPSSRAILIPIRYQVRGKGADGAPEKLRFESHGMIGNLKTGVFDLLSGVFIEVTNKDPKGPPTRAWGSSGTYRRLEESMLLHGRASRPARMEQGSLKSSAHEMEARMMAQGDGSGKGARKASFLAWDDVKIEEWKTARPGRSNPATPDRYSTSGRAEFDPETQQVLLTEYPQVYQDGDTMTGEVIRIRRKEDLVEVENSNAFTSGDKF